MTKKIKYIDGIRFYRSIVVGINNLISRQDYLNQINVFPVPDGDTGTNMAFTVNEILEGTSGTVSSKIGEMSQQVADLALDGARGNSGAILAQFFVGLSESLEKKDKMSVQDFAEAFRKASDNAWDALSDPQEGTILTIFKDLSTFLSEYTSNTDNDDFVPLMELSLAEAQKSLENTPKQMKLLQKAGVVDAGAQGFVDLLEGINQFIQSGRIKDLGHIVNTPQEFEDFEDNHDFSNLTYQFCTECVIEGDSLDKNEIKSKIMEIGDSVVIAGSKKKVKIHIHVNKPHELFEICNKYGVTKNHKADDMYKQQELMQTGKTNKIALVVDSGADFDIEKFSDVFMVPVRYSFGNQGYIDKISQSVDDFYKELQSNPIHPKTSQPTPGDFRRQYQYLSSYYNSIISFHIPEKLSGTYQSACVAAKNTAGSNISVIDGKSMSVGMGLCIEQISKVMNKNDLSHEEAVKKIEKIIKNVEVFTAVKDLSYSVKGGRVPKVFKTISNILNFKPILSVKSDGSMGPVGAYFGKKNIPQKLFNLVNKKIDPSFTYNVLIGHAQSEQDGEKTKLLFEKKSNIFKKVELLKIGGALGVHTGPGAVAAAIQKIDD